MKSNLSNYTVAYIHQVVCNTRCVSAAAKKLKLADCSILTSNLGKYLFNGEPLSVEVLKALSVEDARKIWGKAYAKKIRSPDININQYNAAHIHYLSRQTENVRNLASLLGVRDHTVHRYLSKFTFDHKLLTYEVLKSLSDDEALEIFGDHYEALHPAQRINLTPSILEKSDQLRAEVILERDDFSVLAARFEHDFPMDAPPPLDVQVGKKRNMFDFFSGPCLTDDSEEPTLKLSRQAEMVVKI